MSRVPEGLDRTQLYVVARRVLLDALVALRDQSDAVTIVGAQAIYLHSIDVELAVASFTSDADLGLDPDRLADFPLLEEAMTAAGFARGVADHAGSWLRRERVGSTVADIAVDLLVPESLSDGAHLPARSTATTFVRLPRPTLQRCSPSWADDECGSGDFVVSSLWGHGWFRHETERTPEWRLSAAGQAGLP